MSTGGDLNSDYISKGPVDINTHSAAPVIFYITDNGLSLAKRICDLFPGTEVRKFDSLIITALWAKRSAFVFIMATGIVVRTIAPLIQDKKKDPAVVVLDEQARHVISLVGGHLGGANELAREIAAQLGTDPVITTASDVNNLPAIDLWAKDNGLIIETWDALPRVAARLMNEEGLRVYSESDVALPHAFEFEKDPRHADILITKKQRIEICGSCVKDQLYLRPKNLVLGIGCNSGVHANEIEDVIRTVLLEHNLSFLSIHSLATIDIKSVEPGLLEFATKYGFQLQSFSAGELNTVEGIKKSETVFKATGANAVAEPAALLASGTVKLLVPKQKSGNVTVAVALKKSEGIQLGKKHLSGRLYVVGIGPGSGEHITPRARRVIEKSDIIVGYDTYLDLIPTLIAGKEIFSTGMTKEIDRCRKAVELALTGKKVSVISGGDPGIYAMAGLVFEILRKEDLVSGNPDINIRTSGTSAVRASELMVEIVPGISALNAAASRLGAPLMHDFASISLSDRLTPWELIEKRIHAAASADFVIVLYNPKSKGRMEHFSRAVQIIGRYRRPETPVGIVKGAMRIDEQVTISDLSGILAHSIDMQTTVIFGNSKTFVWNGWMITPRGYESKL
ncbi:MAG: precorrin-3B C(17)-methyltransferase [Dissulfurispiraceae bacterium]|jgi:cobalt-precorrin 5A hydrolase / precorrin-3B C17-methyltransferase